MASRFWRLARGLPGEARSRGAVLDERRHVPKRFMIIAASRSYSPSDDDSLTWTCWRTRYAQLPTSAAMPTKSTSSTPSTIGIQRRVAI